MSAHKHELPDEGAPFGESSVDDEIADLLARLPAAYGPDGFAGAGTQMQLVRALAAIERRRGDAVGPRPGGGARLDDIPLSPAAVPQGRRLWDSDAAIRAAHPPDPPSRARSARREGGPSPATARALAAVL